MRLILFLSIFTATLVGCTQKESPSQQEKGRSVSQSATIPQLTVAILPTPDCLPFYIASQQGIYDSLGLSVRTVIYPSQMDAEQSVIHGKSIGCATDLFRATLLQSQKAPVRYIFSIDREWELIANKKLRISKISQLNDRVVGIARHSVTDYLSDYITTQMKTGQIILRPQINNTDTRMQMLENSQIDAAFLPLPHALAARRKGHTLLPFDDNKSKGFSGFAVSAKWTAAKENKAKARLLQKGYDIAVEKLQKGLKANLPAADLQRFRLKGYETYIKTYRFTKASAPNNGKVETALKWLKDREAVSASFHTDTLLLK